MLFFGFSLFAPHFFFHLRQTTDRCVFLSVVVKNTLSLHSKSKTKACGGHSLIVVMRSLLKGGEEYSSTGDDYYKYDADYEPCGGFDFNE